MRRLRAWTSSPEHRLRTQRTMSVSVVLRRWHLVRMTSSRFADAFCFRESACSFRCTRCVRAQNCGDPRQPPPSWASVRSLPWIHSHELPRDGLPYRLGSTAFVGASAWVHRRGCCCLGASLVLPPRGCCCLGASLGATVFAGAAWVPPGVPSSRVLLPWVPPWVYRLRGAAADGVHSLLHRVHLRFVF